MIEIPLNIRHNKLLQNHFDTHLIFQFLHEVVEYAISGQQTQMLLHHQHVPRRVSDLYIVPWIWNLKKLHTKSSWKHSARLIKFQEFWYIFCQFTGPMSDWISAHVNLSYLGHNILMYDLGAQAAKVQHSGRVLSISLVKLVFCI